MDKKFNNKPNDLHLTSDGKEIWVSRSVAVNCLVIFQTKNIIPDYYVLSEKRGNGLSDESGKWCFPCGYLDWNESAKEAAIREVFEETGLDLDYYLNNGKVIVNDLEQPWFVDSNPSSNRQNVTLRHACIITDDKLPKITNKYSDPNEIELLRWIELDELIEYDWAFGHDKIIREYLNKI